MSGFTTACLPCATRQHRYTLCHLWDGEQWCGPNLAHAVVAAFHSGYGAAHPERRLPDLDSSLARFRRIQPWFPASWELPWALVQAFGLASYQPRINEHEVISAGTVMTVPASSLPDGRVMIMPPGEGGYPMPAGGYEFPFDWQDLLQRVDLAERQRLVRRELTEQLELADRGGRTAVGDRYELRLRAVDLVDWSDLVVER